MLQYITKNLFKYTLKTNCIYSKIYKKYFLRIPNIYTTKSSFFSPMYLHWNTIPSLFAYIRSRKAKQHKRYVIYSHIHDIPRSLSAISTHRIIYSLTWRRMRSLCHTHHRSIETKEHCEYQIPLQIHTHTKCIDRLRVVGFNNTNSIIYQTLWRALLFRQLIATIPFGPSSHPSHRNQLRSTTDCVFVVRIWLCLMCVCVGERENVVHSLNYDGDHHSITTFGNSIGNQLIHVICARGVGSGGLEE